MARDYLDDNALTPGTILVSTMRASNEAGTIQPIGEMSRTIP